MKVLKSIPLLPRPSYSIHLCILCIHYGNGTNGFVEKPEARRSPQSYAYSKLLFDHYVRKHEGEYTAQVVGLRYFNVYGPNEAHKDKMASLVRQMFYKNKELVLSIYLKVQMATKMVVKHVTFIYVKDVVNVNFYLGTPEILVLLTVVTGNAHKL